MIVRVKDLIKRYGNLAALDHFSIEVEEGEVFGLLGPNGAGKTTAVQCMLSLLSCDRGIVELFGKPMKPQARDLKRRIGAALQNTAIFRELTVYENVLYFCSLYIRDKERASRLSREAVSFAGLEDYWKFYPMKLSSGLLGRLNFACAVAHKPELVFLDEPTADADPQSREKLLEGIQKLHENGTTVIVTSRSVEETERLCGRIAIVDRGRSIACGTKEELKGMISLGEKIRIRAAGLQKEQLSEIRSIQNVYFADYKEDMLTVKSNKGRHNLLQVLTYLNSLQIPFGEVHTDFPRLGDVFFELTGKELR